MPDRAVTAQALAINRPAITACIILAVIMQALDTTIANVALPYMQGSVSASQDQIDWVLTSYIVAAAIMTPPTGFLAARFGLIETMVFTHIPANLFLVLAAFMPNASLAVTFLLLRIIPVSHAKKHTQLRHRAKDRLGVARRRGEHSLRVTCAQGSWKTLGMCVCSSFG